MKRYKLVKELPTFKIGDTFYISISGDLCAEDTQGFSSLVAYTKRTLNKFPVILKEWFVEIEPHKSPFSLDYDLFVINPDNKDATPEQLRGCLYDALRVLNERTR